jgi:hypothetical protein
LEHVLLELLLSVYSSSAKGGRGGFAVPHGQALLRRVNTCIMQFD